MNPYRAGLEVDQVDIVECSKQNRHLQSRRLAIAPCSWKYVDSNQRAIVPCWLPSLFFFYASMPAAGRDVSRFRILVLGGRTHLTLIQGPDAPLQSSLMFFANSEVAHFLDKS